MRKFLHIIIFITLFINLSACSFIDNEITQQVDEFKKNTTENLYNESLDFQLVTVNRVIDGDTIEAQDNSGSLMKIRLIGVNTPESTNKKEIYGEEASNYTKSMLEGKQVYLQKDVSDKDHYDRYLRIVWIVKPFNPMDETEIRTKMFNADLILNGYAEPSTYEPDTTYSHLFRKFAEEAREKGLGLWAYGEYGTTKGDFDK